MPEQTQVTPGLGQDIREYTPGQLVERINNAADREQGSRVKQLAAELGRRTQGKS
jgi:hypothetical protein